jgi:predicted tellurium resistance membrane protein TerC
MMEYLLSLAMSPTAWIALATLIAMEVVLGIDNLIFISILTNKLPEHSRRRTRRIGISAALVMRLLLLSTVAFIVQLTEPLFDIFGEPMSWRDIILIAGGLFLVWKATHEIHHSVDPDSIDEDAKLKVAVVTGGMAAIFQILLLDLVFSIDSIVTAVGMTEHLPIMIIAVLVAVGVMMFAADPLADFIARNPTIVMLALGFLLMIGTTLIAEGFGVHVPKGYIYASMAFSSGIEILNMFHREAVRKRNDKSEMRKAALARTQELEAAATADEASVSDEKEYT